jgi:general secretion pathway protein J
MRNNNLDKRKTASGLTLIELLVAITVLAVVAVLGWRGLDSIVRARIALTENLEQTRRMQLTFAQLQSDCAQLVAPNVLPNRVPLVVEPGMLRLVRTVFADDQPSRLQVVTYQLKDGRLTRRESAGTRDLGELDMLWQEAANATDSTDAVMLQSGIAALDMRLWMSGKNGWLTGTKVLAATTPASHALFNGLEVTIKFIGRDTRLLKIFLLGVV